MQAFQPASETHPSVCQTGGLLAQKVTEPTEGRTH